MTREEQYLAKLAGEETEIPSEPRLRSEQYLAKIAGEDVGIPQKPLHNEETYLAILAGEDYEIPAPYNRIEQYMAKACGAEIEVPTPITRVEQLWAQIAEGGSWTVTEITGTLPLTFLSKGDDLIDYRIYGTAEGAGVETENLIPEISTVNGWRPGYLKDDGTYNPSQSKGEWLSPLVDIESATSISISYKPVASGASESIYFFDTNDNYISNKGKSTNGYATFADFPSGTAKVCYAFRTYCTTEQDLIQAGMWTCLVKGDTPPSSYIPHGYKLPLTVESGETENLWDGKFPSEPSSTNQYIPIYVGDGTFTFSTNAPRHLNQYCAYMFAAGNVETGGTSANDGVYAENPRTVQSVNGYVTIIYHYYSTVPPQDYWGMLTEGSTPPDHYIPHRYTSDIPIYIGSSKLDAEEYVDFGEQKIYKRILLITNDIKSFITADNKDFCLRRTQNG